ncbi:hypothetical protein L484_015881 [Morus notabilis]|uniref:Thiaminase-2/PQQC domain-containing protein n=1 Tax=Morus notabilis TaxID=981085 RepID=W9QPB8_9ROSA|nr:bifunctional TH2 protein, mitochondrial [Morus notabilis]EXB46020.1 hypothetical protein L484_015881 [Morus notabilis]
MDNLRLVLTKKETISRRLWKKFESESLFAQYSPFFISLAAGTLALQAFHDFISQDLHLLKAFYHAYLSAEKCLNDDAEKWVVHDLRENLRKEIVAYVKIIQEDFKLPKRETTYATIVNYGDFLHDTKSGKVEGRIVPCKRKIAAFTLCAIVPCMKLYSHLFQQIKKILHPSDTTTHNYKKCIDIYCSEDFEVVLAMRTQFMLEKLSDCFTEDEVEVMEKHYHRAMKLQVDFFAKLPTHKCTLVTLSRLQELRKSKLTIFCDYDMTCPIAESASAVILANMSIALPQVYRMSSEELRNAWDVLDYQRTMDFEQWFETIMSSTMPGRQVFNDAGSESPFSSCRMGDKGKYKGGTVGMLKGISLDTIKSAASTVILQDGCRRFFQKLAENESRNINVHIISNYWGSDLIKAVLSPEKNVFTVHSNELAMKNGVTMGDITRIVETSSNKFKTFHAVIKGCKTEIGHLTVYIGGDVADLLCLLAADIGIVICPSLNLWRLADRFGLKFVALFDELVRRKNEPAAGYHNNWKPYSGVLYTVSCWAEIEAFILGL